MTSDETVCTCGHPWTDHQEDVCGVRIQTMRDVAWCGCTRGETDTV